MNQIIFTAPDSRTFDPLSIYRQLLFQSQNKVNQWLMDWQNGLDELVKAQAEETLVALCRKVFDYKDFSEEGGVVDSVVLDTLQAYLRFTEGKESRG